MQAVLLKISGELLSAHDGSYNVELVNHIIDQLKTLKDSYHIGIVIGGGNIFRGAHEAPRIGISRPTADAVGMLATLINGLMLQDLFCVKGLHAELLSAVPVPQYAQPMSQTVIRHAKELNKLLIFAGGTGNPYFTTDTNAVLRALQMGAQQVWKATTVDGIYDADPNKNPNAQKITNTTYKEVLDKDLKFMDKTAITLAQDHNVVIKVFNLFEKNSLLNVAQNSHFGSTISN